MRTNAECNSWGRKTGTAILGGTSGGGSAQSFVSTALGEVGYREGSGNRTKYGAEMGCDGVAWCVIFVCWCAKHASAPIPTTYTAVSEMRSYFERRASSRQSQSGYKPKAGDIMSSAAATSASCCRAARARARRSRATTATASGA